MTSATCSCGEAWFELLPDTSTTPHGPGAVCLDSSGLVTGHSGVPACIGCGQFWTPPRERLRVIK